MCPIPIDLEVTVIKKIEKLRRIGCEKNTNVWLTFWQKYNLNKQKINKKTKISAKRNYLLKKRTKETSYSKKSWNIKSNDFRQRLKYMLKNTNSRQKNEILALLLNIDENFMKKDYYRVSYFQKSRHKIG